MKHDIIPVVPADFAGRRRCAWVKDDPVLVRYHDEDWGTPPTSDDQAFEALTLEIFQAGLSWRTVLNKRDAFRSAFAGFRVADVSRFDGRDVERLLGDAGIIRHRQKIEATIANAQAVLTIQQDSPSFLDWLDSLPANAEAAYPHFRTRFRFFGPTTCESFLEAIGKIPIEHDPECWRANRSTTGHRS